MSGLRLAGIDFGEVTIAGVDQQRTALDRISATGEGSVNVRVAEEAIRESRPIRSDGRNNGGNTQGVGDLNRQVISHGGNEVADARDEQIQLGGGGERRVVPVDLSESRRNRGNVHQHTWGTGRIDCARRGARTKDLHAKREGASRIYFIASAGPGRAFGVDLDAGPRIDENLKNSRSNG